MGRGGSMNAPPLDQLVDVTPGLWNVEIEFSLGPVHFGYTLDPPEAREYAQELEDIADRVREAANKADHD